MKSTPFFLRIFQFRYKSIVQFVRKDWKSVLIYRFFPLVFQRFNLESCRLANILVRKRAVKEKKISIRLCSRCQKREREFLYSSRVRLRRVGLNSLRFRLRRFASLSPLCQRPLTSSTRFLLLLLALPPPPLSPPLLQPSSSRIGFVILFPSLRSRDRYYGAYLAFLPSCISRFLACRRGYLVAWLLGYSVTKVAKEKGPRSPLCADFCETKRLTSPFRPPPFPLPPPPLFFPLLSALLFTPLCFDQPPSNENARSLILRGLELVFSCLEMPPLWLCVLHIVYKWYPFQNSFPFSSSLPEKFERFEERFVVSIISWS